MDFGNPGKTLMENNVVAEEVLGKDHRMVLIDHDGGYLLRIERPSGAGRALYETMSLSESEGDSLLKLMTDGVG